MNSANISGTGSLAGIRVIEIGTSVAAPYAAQILGDFGADVIKVERTGTGDDSRNWAPPEWEGYSVTFLALNRNKQSVVIDYKTQEGREVMERLIAGADVLIQNLRPGSFAKAGFSAERLLELNPRLIYCEMSGYGRTGPRSQQPAYDPLLQAYSGIVSMTGDDGGAPARVPVSVLDMGTGMWTALAVFEALRRRDVTGEGSHVELSLLQTALTWLTPPLMACAAGDPPPRRLGSGFGGVVPYGAFPTKDGHVFMSAGNDDAWRRLISALECGDLDDLPGFGSNGDRVRNRETVVAALSARTSKFTSAEVVDRLTQASVPHSPVNTVDKVLVDEQVQALGQIQAAPEHAIADLKLVNLPMTFDGHYPAITKAPPELGQDTESVLASLGMDSGQIEALLASGVVEAGKAAITQEVSI